MAQCKCGGETSDFTHEVKTLKGAQEWEASIVDADLPIRVYQQRCRGCGRQEVKVVKNAH